MTKIEVGYKGQSGWTTVNRQDIPNEFSKHATPSSENSDYTRITREDVLRFIDETTKDFTHPVDIEARKRMLQNVDRHFSSQGKWTKDFPLDDKFGGIQNQINLRLNMIANTKGIPRSKDNLVDARDIFKDHNIHKQSYYNHMKINQHEDGNE